MKGLEVREVRLSNVLADEDLRLEGKYYNKNRFHVNCAKGAIIEDFSQYGTSKELNEDNKGYPVLRLNEFDTFFISKPAKNCNLLDSDTYESLRLKKDDVLICRTNGNPKFVGKAAIVPRDYDFAFASYLFRVRTKPNLINAATLVTFLNSKYGRLEIEKFSMISNQANFSPAKFRKISIPLFSKQFNIQIEEIIYQAFAQSEKSKAHYSKAEDILLQELGLKGWQPNNNPVNIKQLKDSFLKSGRLDAEYYQQQYDALLDVLSHFKCNTIIEIATKRKSIEPGSDAYCEEGVPFIRVSDITKHGISKPSVYLSRSNYNVEELRPKKDTILLSKDGSIGIAYKVPEDLDCITSGALLHLNVYNKDYLPDYLTLVLNSIVVQMQAERDSNGAIIQHWKPSEIDQVVIPCLPMETQVKIANTVQDSFRLREESKRLLDVAKKAVEIAISENEEKAMQFIKENENGKSLYN